MANVKGLDKVVVTFSSVLTHNSVNIPERIYYLFSTSMSIFFSLSCAVIQTSLELCKKSSVVEDFKVLRNERLKYFGI